MRNPFIDRGGYFEIVLFDKYGAEAGRALVDREDVCRVGHLRWYLNNHGYVVADTGGRKNRIRFLLHRVVMAAAPNDKVDHVRCGIVNRRNCRRENVRLCTPQQNAFHSSKKSNNTSGKKGVSWDHATGKWRTTIQIGGKSIYLGIFSDIANAAAAYDTKARELFGEFSFTNEDIGTEHALAHPN